MSLFDRNDSAGAARAGVRKVRLEDALLFLGADDPRFRILTRLESIQQRHAEEAQAVADDVNLSEIGKKASIDALKETLRADIAELRTQLAAVTPRPPTQSAPAPATPEQIAMATQFAQLDYRARNKLEAALLGGERPQLAAALVAVSGELSEVTPVIRARLAARMTATTEAEQQTASTYQAETGLQALVADTLNDFESSINK